MSIDDVRIGPGFWGDRQRLNGEVILDHCRSWMDRVGWIANFASTADERRGREFTDADVYKLVEAMCWESARTDRDDLLETIASLGGLIAGAQEPDGYLNTRFGHQGVDARYRDLEWGHELYCAGHLLQAGVARLRTGAAGDDPLAAAVLQVADHVCRAFGPEGNQGVDGHPVIETALVELYRATGADRYLAQAQRFVSRRGRPALADIGFGRAYFQDDVPVRSAPAFRGHAVRALYLAAGVVDVAVETDDRELLEVVADQWQRTVAHRTYLTGGMGSRHEGESFGEDDELPPDRAYAETCAGVASIQLAWRLLLATGESRYADLIERTLYNVVAAAVALDGRSFFYTNPLQVRVPPSVPDPAAPSPRAAAGLRAPWYDVACCPPNVARLLASLPVRARWTYPAPQVDAVRGCVAVERGPIVYCAESPVADAAAEDLSLVSVDDTSDPVDLPPLHRPAGIDDPDDPGTGGLAGPLDRAVAPGSDRPMDRPAVHGMTAASPPAPDGLARVGVSTQSLPGTEADDEPPRPLELIPYHRWGNRGPATMRVWLPLAGRRR